MRPHTRILSVLLLLLPCGCRAFSSDAPDAVLRRNLSLVVGQRDLDDRQFPGIDDPTLYGVELDMLRAGALLGFEVGLNHSSDDADLNPGTSDADISELYFGVRKTFELQSSRARPYLGAGVTLFHTGAEFEGADSVDDGKDDDTDGGIYARTGVNILLTDRLYLGVDYRYVLEEPSDYGGFDLDQGQVSIRIGFSF